MEFLKKHKERLQNLLGLIVGFAIIAWWSGNYMIGYVAGGVGVAGMIIAPLGNLILKVWFKIAEILGWINSKVLLTLMYVLFLLPMSLLYKLTNRNALFLNKKVDDTYYETRNHKYTKEDIEKTW